MSKKNISKKKSRPLLDDPNLTNLSTGYIKSNNSATIQREFDIPSKSGIGEQFYDNYDEMELNQHLVELWTVLRNIAKTVFIATAITLVLPGFSDGKLTIDPYEPAVLQILNILIDYSLNSLESGGDVQVFIGSPLTPVTFYLNIGAFVAILISLPITVKELMSFVRPGLTEKEWEILKRLSKTAGILFVIGTMISYFIIMPVTLRVLALSGGVVGGGHVLQMYSLDSVLNLLLWGTLGGGLLYSSPVILLALVNLEVITPDQISERKRELNFAIFTIAAFVTPDPTIVSMLILSIPMVFVIEFIIAMSYRIELEKILGD